MGLVRKTMSIGTLGLVHYRSADERALRKAQKELGAANADLERERSARAEAEEGISRAQERAHAAEVEARKAARAASRHRGRKGKKAQKNQTVLDRIGPMVEAAVDAVGGAVGDAVEAAEPKVRATASEARHRSRRAARRTKAEAKRASAKGRHSATRTRRWAGLMHSVAGPAANAVLSSADASGAT